MKKAVAPVPTPPPHSHSTPCIDASLGATGICRVLLNRLALLRWKRKKNRINRTHAPKTHVFDLLVVPARDALLPTAQRPAPSERRKPKPGAVGDAYQHFWPLLLVVISIHTPPSCSLVTHSVAAAVTITCAVASQLAATGHRVAMDGRAQDTCQVVLSILNDDALPRRSSGPPQTRGSRCVAVSSLLFCG